LNKIAFFQNRRDEVPNQQLAKELAQTKDKKGIQEIAKNLWSENPDVQGDCIKVLYEIGYLDPKLIAGYVDDFLKLLHSKNNRLVWGGMTALSTIAGLRAKEIYPRRAEIMRAMDKGSVITQDGGVQTLALIASAGRAIPEAHLPLLAQAPGNVPTQRRGATLREDTGCRHGREQRGIRQGAGAAPEPPDKFTSRTGQARHQGRRGTVSMSDRAWGSTRPDTSFMPWRINHGHRAGPRAISRRKSRD
jgi:hypothetical protein